MVDTASHVFALIDLIAKHTADIDALGEIGRTHHVSIVGTVGDVALGIEVTAFLGASDDSADRPAGRR
jgi:hypothetical protein